MNDDLQPDHRPAFPYSRFLVGLALLCGTTSLLLWPIGWLNTIPNLSGSRHLTTLTFATLGISVAMFLALKVLEHSGDFDIHRRAGRASWMLLAIATTAYFPPPISFPSVLLCFAAAATFAAVWLLEPLGHTDERNSIRAYYWPALLAWVFVMGFGILGLIHAKRMIMTFRFD